MDHERESATLKRQAEVLAKERMTLFARANANSGLSVADQTRLKAIERELDECFNALRRQRAAADVRRFDREDRRLRTTFPVRPRPEATK